MAGRPHGGHSFNGAATLVSRKDLRPLPTAAVAPLLQWGRDFSVAEGKVSSFGRLLTSELQWGRDFSVAEGAEARAVESLQITLQWGRDFSVAEGCLSNPPRPSGIRLQWGRNLTVAEGRTSGPSRGQAPASMGPQLDSCGRRPPGENDLPTDSLQWGRNLTVAEGILKYVAAAMML